MKSFVWLLVTLMTLETVAMAADGDREILGRWDLAVQAADGRVYPSWIEVKLSGYRTLVGSYVGEFGSARPVSKIMLTEGRFSFSVPPQWEQGMNDITVSGMVSGNAITGEVTDEKGNKLAYKGVRAPELKRDRAPEWGAPIELFNGKDLSGWKARSDKRKNGWEVKNGVLTNAQPGNDIISEQKFEDFKLHAEFRYPKGSNSGIYLRGRYEVQIEDNFGQEAESHKIGGVYGHLTPSVNAARPAGEWQTMDIELVGRVVTVHLNGERILDRQTIPGITGGALDSEEGTPGPLFIQGDHGPVEFRKLTITPAK